MTNRQEELIPKTPEAEAEHQKFLKRCQEDSFLVSAIKYLVDAWLVSDGEDTEKLSLGIANAARPIIEKQERERIFKEVEENSDVVDWDDEENGIKREFQESWWQALKEDK